MLIVKLDSETVLRVLRIAGDDLNQRMISESTGFSLGKTNYIVRALIDKGLLKAKRFAKSDKKLKYSYALTPSGITERIRLTEQFIEQKRQEYELLEQELKQLKG